MDNLCPLLPGFAQYFIAASAAVITSSGLKPPVAALSKYNNLNLFYIE